MHKTKLKHHILHIAPLTLSLFVLSNNTSALEYQNNTNIQFTFNPTLSIDISGNLTIDNLSPGTSANSNEITLSIATNNLYGYNLSATVGNNDTYNTRNLVHSNNALSVTPTITSIDYTADSSAHITELSLDSNNNGMWGYSIDGGNSYNGLPLYNDATSIALLNGSITTPENGIATTKFLIGAIASPNQPAGTYNNVINFYATANMAPATFNEAFVAAGKQLYKGYYTMQDMSSTICDAVETNQSTSLIDTRDNEVYIVSKLIDSNCWMLDNLRLGGGSPINLASSNTNIQGEYTLPASSNTDFSSYQKASVYAGNKNQVVLSYGIGSGKVGAYYTFCAATAGTYCFAKDAGVDLPDTLIDAPQDICPANWRMPTSNADGEYATLCSAINGSSCTHIQSMESSNPNSMQYILSTPFSGNFGGTQAFVNEYGWYWSSTYRDQSQTFDFHISTNYVLSHDWGLRSAGNTIRCLAK